jgi:hypothetical protein
MRKIQQTLFCVLLLSIMRADAQSTGIKRRADSFFGVHFDFHAAANDNQIGALLTPEMVNRFLTQVKPDFIQVDTKGHPGLSSYPTKTGIAARGIVRDPLKIFRAATSAKGIGLYSHFSGVIDAGAVKAHPTWARINSNGQHDPTATSIFGPYCDSYFIPQIKELSRNYNIDGVWVDGEVWAVQPDFSEAAKKAYLSATGKKAEPNAEYMEYNRKAFHSYLSHYTSVLHTFNPRLQIASNWAFSTFMPGRINAAVDFLSGDIVNDDVKNMTIEPRVFSAHHKPWDLMVWGFMADKNGQGHFWKSALQLQQKASIIISQGGGFQVYINQNHDASIPLETAPVLKQVADFCFARKPYTFKTTAVPQAAILFSASGHYYDLGTSTAFDQVHGGNNNIKGTLAALLNSQYSVEVLQEHQLSGTMGQYPLLVITEWNYLEPKFISEVQDYVRNGGKLLLIGPVTCGLFNGILPVAIAATTDNAAGLPIKKNNYGRGVVMGINANISLKYLNEEDDNIRKTIASLTKQLFPTPAVTIQGSEKVHIVLNRVGNKSLIHLINVNDRWTTTGNQLNFQLPPLKSLEVLFRTAKKPAKILLQPGNTILKFEYNNGVARFNTPAIDVYSIVEVKY